MTTKRREAQSSESQSVPSSRTSTPKKRQSDGHDDLHTNPKSPRSTTELVEEPTAGCAGHDGETSRNACGTPGRTGVVDDPSDGGRDIGFQYLESAKANPPDQGPSGLGLTLAPQHVPEAVPELGQLIPGPEPDGDLVCDHGKLWDVCEKLATVELCVQVVKEGQSSCTTTHTGRRFCSRPALFWHVACGH